MSCKLIKFIFYEQFLYNKSNPFLKYFNDIYRLRFTRPRTNFENFDLEIIVLVSLVLVFYKQLTQHLNYDIAEYLRSRSIVEN